MASDNCDCDGTLLPFSRLQTCVNSVFEDKEKENCLTKGQKFQFLCTCYPRSPVTALSGAKYILNACWNKQHTWVSPGEYSMQSCLLCEPDEFTHNFFFSCSNAETRSQGRLVDLWHSVADTEFKNQRIRCFHSYSDFCRHSLYLADILFW